MGDATAMTSRSQRGLGGNSGCKKRYGPEVGTCRTRIGEIGIRRLLTEKGCRGENPDTSQKLRPHFAIFAKREERRLSINGPPPCRRRADATVGPLLGARAIYLGMIRGDGAQKQPGIVDARSNPHSGNVLQNTPVALISAVGGRLTVGYT